MTGQRNVGGRAYVPGMTDISGCVYGTPGCSLGAAGSEKYGPDARRGEFFERATARALEHWLGQRADAGAFRLFHDLGNFVNMSGQGLRPISLGTANIDHLVLTGSAFALIDSKGTAAGTLTLDARGRGVLVRPDGATQAEPWLDSRKTQFRHGGDVPAHGPSRLPCVGCAISDGH